MTNQQENEVLKKIIEENHRALRGSNGTPGLVADVTHLKKDIEEIKSNHLPHIIEEVKTRNATLEVNILKALEIELIKVQNAINNVEVKRKATNWDRVIQIGTALAIAFLVFQHGL